MAVVGRSVVATAPVAGTAVPIIGAGVPMPGGAVYTAHIVAKGTGPVYIGDSTVTAATGMPIAVTTAPIRIEAMGMDLKQLYIVSATAGDSVAVLYFQVV